MHLGMHGFTLDARGLAHDMQGCWGVSVAGRCACGQWSPAILQAMKDEVLSINPLELLTCAIALIVARQENAV